MERFAAGDEVAMPSRLLTVSNTRTVVVAAFRMRKAEVEFVVDWNEATVVVPYTVRV